MRKKGLKIAIAATLALVISICAAGCGKSKDKGMKDIKVYERTESDTRDISDFEYTVNNISATDALGRSFLPGDGYKKDKYVGMFYFLWLGQHRGAGQEKVYDVSDLLENDPDSLWDVSDGNKASPVGVYHHWGKSIFGYYDSDDEWVIRKHVEMFLYAGLDFICFDTTNAVTYTDVALKVMYVLDDFAKQGFRVPSVMFYTNSSSITTMGAIYNSIYMAHPEYSDLWFAPNGKPMIVGVLDDLIEDYDADLNPVYRSDCTYLTDFFEVKDSQWPNEKNLRKQNGFPWIEFTYPQINHGGVMNVSVAQHNTVRMSNESDGNRGRGFNTETFLNEDERGIEGLNYQSQWNTVFNNDDQVNITFITGWNEWIAIKFRDSVQNKAFFVDTFNMNYSRDIEPMVGGYGDNFYLQTISNIRKYKYAAPKHYKYTVSTPSGISDAVWNGVRAFRDPTGDCADRNHIGYDRNTTYTDASGRNDLSEIKVVHDENNLYIRIACAGDITARDTSDKSFLNVYIGTDAKSEYRYGDYQFVVNRSVTGDMASVEKISAFGKYETVGSATYVQSGKYAMIAVPLSALGLRADACHVLLKVTDNVLPTEDMSSFYTTGDCAPIGRLSYSYGY